MDKWKDATASALENKQFCKDTQEEEQHALPKLHDTKSYIQADNRLIFTSSVILNKHILGHCNF